MQGVSELSQIFGILWLVQSKSYLQILQLTGRGRGCWTFFTQTIKGLKHNWCTCNMVYTQWTFFLKHSLRCYFFIIFIVLSFYKGFTFLDSFGFAGRSIWDNWGLNRYLRVVLYDLASTDCARQLFGIFLRLEQLFTNAATASNFCRKKNNSSIFCWEFTSKTREWKHLSCKLLSYTY